MIIALRTQFHIERPWGQHPFSSRFQPGEGPSSGLLCDYEPSDGPFSSSSLHYLGPFAPSSGKTNSNHCWSRGTARVSASSPGSGPGQSVQPTLLQLNSQCYYDSDSVFLERLKSKVL